MADDYARMKFKAPIPGQSLTAAPGSAAYQRPPQFADPDEALEYVFDAITKPRNVMQMITVLESGATCESLARTLVFQGFAAGKWSPDVALLIARPVLYLIVALAKRKKVKNLRILNPDRRTNDFLKEAMENVPVEAYAEHMITPEESLETAKEMTEPKRPFGGIMNYE